MCVEVILTDIFPDIIRYTHIQCVTYGALAHRLNAFWRSNTADVVVCVLRLWRIEWGAGIVYLFAIFNFPFRIFGLCTYCRYYITSGFNYITNMEDGSDILFDSDIP